jgi:hypothetical protein
VKKGAVVPLVLAQRYLPAGISTVETHRISTNHSCGIARVGRNFKIWPGHDVVQQKVFTRFTVVDNCTIYLAALYQDTLAIAQKNCSLEPAITIKMASIKGETSLYRGSDKVVFSRMVKVKAMETAMTMINLVVASRQFCSRPHCRQQTGSFQLQPRYRHHRRLWPYS